MFTVLIAEKEHIDAIQQENKLFFEPFLRSKDLVFCQWNPEGQTLEESVPGLIDAVGREKKWRAVILNNCKGEALKARNPFDIVDSSALADLAQPSQFPESDDLRHQWEEDWKTYFESLAKEKEEIYKNALALPLQKLSTWLCYRPEGYILNDAIEHESVHDWAVSQIGLSAIKTSAVLEVMERDQYKYELRLKEQLRKDFVADKYLNIAYPSEIHCISLRTADSNFFDPNAYWTLRNENEYSSFADRNMYFDKMRFLVFDLLPRTHRDFRTDYIRFLASVLIFASNPVPSSAMQARHLYQLETETDDTPLTIMVNSYDKKLAATADFINTEMDRIRGEIPGNLSDKEVEALISTPRDVSVVLDQSCDEDKVYADTDYGLFYDSPENEFNKWNRSYDISQNALAYIGKQRIRAIRQSVGQSHLASEIMDVDVTRFTPYQVEDVKDVTDNLENEMIDAIPESLADMNRYTEQLEKESEKVKKVTRRRMTMKTTIILMAIFLGLFLMCFLPFMFANGSTPKMVTTAVVVTLCMLGALAAIMFVSLFFLRTTIKKAVNAYNDSAHGIMSDIRHSLACFSRYLSTMCNVRRGHAIQKYSTKNVDEYTKRLRIRQKHLEDIRKLRAHLEEEYHDYFGDRTQFDETMSRPYEYDFDMKKEYDYDPPFLAGDARHIEFISSGNFVSVPSSYIKKISVRMEGIYE